MNEIDTLCKNAVDVIDRLELEARLKEGKPLRVKAGFDPSAPDIHLGHTVLLRKLRQFQDAGHKVLFIIGDYTAMIGDPTGKSVTRPMLTRDQIDENARTYQQQAFKILDKDSRRVEVVRNSDWLDKISLQHFLAEIATRFTVARIIERDDFTKRLAENQPISFRELVYPLIQAYDSVAVKADVEVGGTDQKFNLLAGRDLQRSMGQRAQVVMTFPLLVGLDGTQKMSKSLNNYVGVTHSAKEMFGKIMSIPDTLMPDYYNLLTDVTGISIISIREELHPKEAKIKLAKLIVTQYHGEKAADEQATEFDRIFSKKENPENPEELKIAEKEIWIADLLKRVGVVTSTSEAKRLIEQGAVSIDGQKVTDFNLKVPTGKGSLVRAGKKKFVKLV